MIWLLLAAALAKGPVCPRPEAEQEAYTAELKAMVEAQRDEAVRRASGEEVPEGLKARLKAVRRAVDKAELCTAEDRYHAALLLVESGELEDAAAAYALAQKVMEERYVNGAWLLGLAFDRWRVSEGALQSYGTQLALNDNRRCLVWTDLSFTDAKRKQYGHPPLVDTYRKVLEMNGFTGVEPTLAELKKRGLWCRPVAFDGREVELTDPAFTQ